MTSSLTFEHTRNGLCALTFCYTPVSRDAHFAIQAYLAVSIRRVHRRHRGWPSSAFSGFYFYAQIPYLKDLITNIVPYLEFQEILNHCFDEIEAFIGLLQKAAEAYTELVRRRKLRKSKKREPGDGLLLARSRPPPESEYIECLKKFKFCFNLLVCLDQN